MHRPRQRPPGRRGRPHPRRFEEREDRGRRARPAPAVVVQPPQRTRRPLSVVADLGPTNSGKTHDALAFLAERGAGIYAAPLRMLAHEARERLVARVGEERVGLVTGEERINDRAPILCCTAEMAPAKGDVLVLDEVQWAADPDRGQAWTRLLAYGDYRHVRILGAPDALPLVRAAFPEAELRTHERFSPLEWIGTVDWQRLEPQTVVIAFSRRAVLFLADRLAQRYGRERVVALYGAMPVAARRAQIGRFLAGEADLVVATDVLGHGVNLPCETILFAETEKFDGMERRPLEPWEAAQIAGRAGRFGLASRGRVGLLHGFNFFVARARDVRAGLTPTVDVGEGLRGYREVTHGRLRPLLDELGTRDPDELRDALRAWEREAWTVLADHPWLRVEPTRPARDRLAIAHRACGGTLRGLKAGRAWQLATSPLDPDHPGDREVLGALARELAFGDDHLARLLPPKRLRWDLVALEEAEDWARTAQALRWCAQAFPHTSVKAARAAELERRASDQVQARLAAGGDLRKIGRCARCGSECAPWFRICQECFEERNAA